MYQGTLSSLQSQIPQKNFRAKYLYKSYTSTVKWKKMKVEPSHFLVKTNTFWGKLRFPFIFTFITCWLWMPKYVKIYIYLPTESISVHIITNVSMFIVCHTLVHCKRYFLFDVTDYTIYTIFEISQRI